MPGTRKKVVSSGNTRTLTEDESPSKKSKPTNNRGRGRPPDDHEGSTNHKSSDPAVTPPQTGRRRKEAVTADEEPASTPPAGKVPEKQPVKAGKPTAAGTTPGKPGRPRKENKAHGASTGADRKGSSLKKDGDKTLLSPKPKAAEEAGGVFSPRRSGRSVVPNRRFQDMEVDLGAIGRKRPKEDTADAPTPKRVKTTTTTKKLSSDKSKDSPPGKSVVTKPSVAGEAAVRAASSVATRVAEVQAKCATLSPPILTSSSASLHSTQSPAPAAQHRPSAVTSSVASSSSPPPRHKQLAAASSPSKHVSRSVSVTVAASRSVATSVAASRSVATSVTSSVAASRSVATSVTSSVAASRSVATSVTSSVSSLLKTSVSSLQSADAAGLVSLLSSVNSSGVPTASRSSSPPKLLVTTASSQSLLTSSPSVTASLSAGVTSGASPSVAVRQPAPSVSSPEAVVVQPHPSQRVSPAAEHQTWPASGEACEEVSVQSCGESVAQSAMEESDIAMVADLTEAAEVEIADQGGEQVSDTGPEVVTVSTSPRSLLGVKDRKGAGEAPGRVVNRPLAFPTSKSVFIVRHPAGGPTESSVEDRSQHKTSLLSAALTEAPSKVTTVKREAGVGDVMSIVELSPNKKVPVVLAERKEHAGKMVKVISSQQMQQLPPAMQKMVSSQLSSRAASVREGWGESLPQQQPKMMTVRIASPPSRTTAPDSGVSVTVIEDDDPNKANDPSSSDPPPQRDQEPWDGMTPQQSGPDLPVNLKDPSVTKASASVGTATVETPASASSDQDGSASCDENKGSGEGGEKEDKGSVRDKYVTSGTQTPYTKKNFTKKVITVHVHPPSKDGEKNTEIVTVTKVEKEEDDASSDMDDSEDREEEGLRGEVVNSKGKYIIVDLPEGSTVKQPYVQRHADRSDSQEDTDNEEEGEGEDGEEGEGHEMKPEKKEKFIIVDLPEGTTVKQQYVRRAERIDSDPDFYTMDEKGLFTCHICQYQSYRRANFYKHKKKHLGLRPYACDQCAYRAATTSNLKRHQEIHRDVRNHKCPVCHLYFRQKIHLERHIKYRHEEKKVKCPLCDYVCANENPDLKVHIKRRHIPTMGGQEALSAFKCPQCGLLASSKRDLRQHLKFHSKGPELKLFCNMCSFVTDCESRLRRHQYIHTKEKPFLCGLCDYRGSQKEHVLRHMRTQHNIEIERKHRIKKPGSEKLPEEGSGSGSGSSKGLEKADYTSDEKIFACNHCNMKFSKLINLYKHLHTQHRDIMPMEKEDFSCVVCDFRTANKKNLLVHMRRHNVTDQSPPSHVYSCVLCRYMNPKRRNLFQHMRKKHHIEIVMKDDGSSTCYVSSDPVSGAVVGSTGGVVVGAGGQPLSVDGHHGVSSSQESVVNVLPITDLISTITQPTAAELHAHHHQQVVSSTAGTITLSAAGQTGVPATIKMEDLALVVSNPHTAAAGSRVGVVEGVESFTMGGAFSQDDAAEAIQGLQALAQRGVLDPSSVVTATATAVGGAMVVEEQVQVMGSDDQTTLVIDPSGLSLVDQLVTPKAEPLQVVEIDHSQLLDPHHHHHQTSSILPLDDSGHNQVPVVQGDGSGFQLSAEQLMNLSTGDYLEINGEMFKVEVSTEGSQGQQIISFEPASVPTTTVEESEGCAPPEEDDLQQESLESSEVSLESTPEMS